MFLHVDFNCARLASRIEIKSLKQSESVVQYFSMGIIAIEVNLFGDHRAIILPTSGIDLGRSSPVSSESLSATIIA